jgi:hypothetical protein
MELGGNRAYSGKIFLLKAQLHILVNPYYWPAIRDSVDRQAFLKI